MKKLLNIIRNICFVLVLCYLTYHTIRVFQPNLIEEYLVLHHDVQSTPLSIANTEGFSLLNEIPKRELPKKLTLKDRNHQVYFHPSDLIRVDIFESTATLYLVNNQKIEIKTSLNKIWETLENYQLSNAFWKNPSHILNLSHIIEMKSQNVSGVPDKEKINIPRKNDYRPVITFSNQGTLTLRKSNKKELETALSNYLSNPN